MARYSEENSNLARVEYQNEFDAHDSKESSNLARFEYNAQDFEESIAALQEYSDRMDLMPHCLRSAKECKECTKSRVFTAMVIGTELGNGNAGVSVVVATKSSALQQAMSMTGTFQ